MVTDENVGFGINMELQQLFSHCAYFQSIVDGVCSVVV